VSGAVNVDVGVGVVVAVGGAAVGVSLIAVSLGLEAGAAWRASGREEKARAAARREAAGRAAEWEAAARAVLDRNARIAVYAESIANARLRGGDQLAIAAPEPLCVAGQSAQELLAWCRQVDVELGAVGAALAERAAAAMAAELFGGASSALGGQPSGPVSAAEVLAALAAPPVRGAGGEAAALARQRLAESLARVLGRIHPDAAAGDWDAVQEAAARVVGAPSAGEALDHLGEVRVRVEEANSRARQRVDEAVTAARMLQGLAGYAGQGAAETRSALAEVVAGRRGLDAELGRAAVEQLAAHQAELEHRYVVEKVVATLGELGYEVVEGFETLTVGNGVSRLARGGWTDHAVSVVVDQEAGEIRTAVVRTSKGAGEEQRRVDAEREQQWCDSFAAARERLAAAGIHAVTTLEVPPGQRTLPVAPVETARQASGRTQAKKRERSQ
jgi:hypothetical protein